MFEGATAFNGDLSGWNVSSVTDMERHVQDLAAWPSKFNARPLRLGRLGVTDMEGMFNRRRGLQRRHLRLERLGSHRQHVRTAPRPSTADLSAGTSRVTDTTCSATPRPSTEPGGVVHRAERHRDRRQNRRARRGREPYRRTEHDPSWLSSHVRHRNGRGFDLV